MVSIQSKVKNNLRFYAFFINAKNVFLTIIKNLQIPKFIKIFKKKLFFFTKIHK